MVYEQLEKRVDGLTWKVELLSLRAGFLSQFYSILDRDFNSTGLGHGHSWPPDFTSGPPGFAFCWPRLTPKFMFC